MSKNSRALIVTLSLLLASCPPGKAFTIIDFALPQKFNEAVENPRFPLLVSYKFLRALAIKGLANTKLFSSAISLWTISRFDPSHHFWPR